MLASVAAMQGRIAMTSQTGQGSIFSLVIPTGVEVQGQATLAEEATSVSSNPCN